MNELGDGTSAQRNADTPSSLQHYSIGQAAAILGISAETLRRNLVRWPHREIGTRKVLSVEDIRRISELCYVGPDKPREPTPVPAEALHLRPAVRRTRAGGTA